MLLFLPKTTGERVDDPEEEDWKKPSWPLSSTDGCIPLVGRLHSAALLVVVVATSRRGKRQMCFSDGIIYW